MTYHVERFRPSFRHETNNWGPTITRAEMLSSSAGDYVRYSDYEALRARLETVEAETRERCAQTVEPKRPRPCTCERCECDKPEDAEDVGRWDGAYTAAAAIRNLEPRHD